MSKLKWSYWNDSSTHTATAPLLVVCKIKAEPILYKVHPGGYFFNDETSPWSNQEVYQFFISHSLDVQTEIKLLNGLYYTHCSTFGGV